MTPSGRILQRILSAALSRRRLYEGLEEPEIAERIRDLPEMLRGWAKELECPHPDLRAREAPALEGYSLWAPSYDDPTNRVILAEEEVIWPLVGDVRGKTVLDAGCGTGRHAVRLAQQGASVVGSEPSAALLRCARAKAEGSGVSVTWRTDAIDALPADLGLFDLVLCCLVLSHVRDLAGAVARLSAHLRPGGALLMTDFHPFCLVIGLRTCCSHEGHKVLLPNYIHLPSQYFAAACGAGLDVTDYLEPCRFPEIPDAPTAIVMRAILPAASRY